VFTFGGSTLTALFRPPNDGSRDMQFLIAAVVQTFTAFLNLSLQA